jgi:hypothetical protein
MANHVSGTSAPISVPPTYLSELRQYILTPLLNNSLFSKAELLRATHFVHECEDIPRLIRWGANVLAEIARRQTETARQHCYLATSATLRRLCSSGFRGPRSRPRRPKPTWVPGAFFPDRADRWAGTFDRLGAARFQPANSLPFAALLSRPSR